MDLGKIAFALLLLLALALVIAAFAGFATVSDASRADWQEFASTTHNGPYEDFTATPSAIVRLFFVQAVLGEERWAQLTTMFGTTVVSGLLAWGAFAILRKVIG